MFASFPKAFPLLYPWLLFAIPFTFCFSVFGCERCCSSHADAGTAYNRFDCDLIKIKRGTPGAEAPRVPV